MTFNRHLIASVLLIAFLEMAATNVLAQSAGDIARKSFPSVVLLLMEDARGQILRQGSGFFVEPGIIVTNFHVIERAGSGIAKLTGHKRPYTIAGVVAVDRKRDLALIKIRGAKGIPLLLGDSSKVSVGDTVYAVGNPLGLEGTFSKGIVSAIRHLGPDTVLQITAPISPGSSGGPILDAQGKVIGIAVATVRRGQNLNFAIPSYYLDKLLRARKPLTPLAQSARRTKTKSILANLGGQNSVRGVRVTHFSWGGAYVTFFQFAICCADQ